MDLTTTSEDAYTVALPFTLAEDAEVNDLWWTRWSLLAPYWQGYRRTLLQANFLKGYLLKELRIAPRETPHIPGTMERFLNLPPELKLEVFQHLHVIDMYHLSLTSRSLHDMLWHPSLYPLWKEAFARIPLFPSCPPALTQPQWAALMFGPVRCQDCGRFGAQPDVALYRNYCSPCTEKRFLSKQDILEMYKDEPDPKDLYLRIKPLCQTRCRLVTLQSRLQSSQSRSEKKFLREQVEEYASKVIGELKNADFGREAVDGTWKIDRIDQITATNEHTMVTLRWVVNVLTELQDDHRKRLKNCIRRCMTRIENMNLGYSDMDILKAVDHWKKYFHARGTQKMTRKEFRKHKDFLIHTVKNCAIGRLRTVRLAEISTICASYRSRVPPHDWWRCPPPAALMDAPCFQEYINQSIAHATTFDQDPISLLPQIANDWIEDRRRALYRAIGLGSKVLANDSLDELNLAKCVFVCMQCRSGGYVDRPPVVSLCGWRRACTHMCHIKSKDHTLLEFSWRGEEVVTAMLESLGMDPGTTTAQEMDDLDMRFLCGDCEIGTHRKGILGKKVYTWAECVNHALQETETSHTTFLPLSDQATRYTKDHERVAYRGSLSKMGNWGCVHCSEHEDLSVCFPAALTHVKKKHPEISVPTPGRDILRFDNRYDLLDLRPRRPFVYSLSPPMRMTCKACPPLRITRLWSEEGLEKHLKEKHGVTTPEDGQQYMGKIDILRAPTNV